MGSNELFLMIFVIVLMFTLKKIKNIFSVRKKLEGEVETIQLRGRKVLLLLSLFLVGFGSVYAFQIRDFFSIIYVLIGIAYSIIAMDKLYVAKNAFCYDGKFIEYRHIKKWTALSGKFLEVIHNTNDKEETLMIPLDIDSINKLSEIIKNNKGSKPKNKGKK